jgi:15-cis-phytoene synthase
MNSPLEASYLRCQHVARNAASSFYPCFRVLPPPKRQAMVALYAFFRQTDDITDEDLSLTHETRRSRLADWRGMLEATLAGENVHPFSLALHDAVERYAIPHEYLRHALDGAEMDFHRQRYETIDDLLGYCYRVASTVGLACIHVWGFSDERAIGPATQCGYAFQLTNILRDLKEDADRGRVYLPQEDAARFDYSTDELAKGVIDQRYRRLLAWEIQRTEGYYMQARELYGYLHADGQRIFRVMSSAYWSLFQQIRRHQEDLFRQRISLPWLVRIRLAAGIWLSPALLPGR